MKLLDNEQFAKKDNQSIIMYKNHGFILKWHLGIFVTVWWVHVGIFNNITLKNHIQESVIASIWRDLKLFHSDESIWDS